VINGSQAQARIMFLSQSEGGRRTPAISGIKPQLKVGDIFTSCFVWGESTDQIFVPGVEYLVDLQFPFWEEYSDRFTVGMHVQLREGTRIIATGSISAIL